MADHAIETWNKTGLISLWHYEDFPKSYCGYHLTADPKGCVFLLGLMERFRNAVHPARKRIILDAPTAGMLAVPNCPRKCVPAESVEFRFRRDMAGHHWSVIEKDREVRIEMGSDGLADLERGAKDMIVGVGDWSIGTGRESLWFW